ncbi:hypothetical protein DYB25_005413 [Aphanomyces astaci]|uniref:Autophagy protein ATG17-like domain-containing protein n=1 Tax=Aphanomyces astaci TaxID=112090 RepID=A0A397AV58_APHAT|nr:hypothetical protein DYB25_005413 [Aphanomyces astaci]
MALPTPALTQGSQSSRTNFHTPRSDSTIAPLPHLTHPPCRSSSSFTTEEFFPKTGHPFPELSSILRLSNVLPTAPPSTSSSHAKLLQETSSPLLRALFDYESQFQQQLLMAEAVESTAKARLAATEACLEQLDAQTRGIQAALSNLDAHHTYCLLAVLLIFIRHAHAQSDHSTLLEHFDTYVHRLGLIPLHPALASDTRLTLLDCIPLDRERDWLVSCKQSQASLEAKMDGLAASFRVLSDAITEQSSAVVSVGPSSWRHTVDEFAAKVAAISSMRDALRQNYDAVSKRVADSTQQTMDEAAATATTASMNMSFMFGSTHILEACRGLDDLFRQQADVLPNMQNADDQLKTIMNSVADAKAEAYGVVCTNLKRVSELQCNIVAFETHLGMLKDALAYQKRQFAELKHVEAYDACVVEIKRRRQYGRLFQARINEMGEAMVGMRDAEIAKREAFLREHGQHLPRDLAPGLTEKPSHCINLPAIEEDAIDDPPNELQVLKQRCQALERQVETLQIELDEQHKAS